MSWLVPAACTFVRGSRLSRLARLMVVRFPQLVTYRNFREGLVLLRKPRSSSSQEQQDIRTIENTGLLRPDFCLPPGAASIRTDLTAALYVRSWADAVWKRKPFPGFHPAVFQERAASAGPKANPYAAYLRAGAPPGPWNQQVISNDGADGILSALPFRAALHVHAHDYQLFPDILRRVEINRWRPDLLVSVTSREAAVALEKRLRHYAAAVDIRIAPNRGRNLGALLTEFGPEIVQEYQVIGHVHTKTTRQDSARGTRWRWFLLENLVGGRAAMIDAVLRAMALDHRIGLVFADDPNVVGWDVNLQNARMLAEVLGVREMLPENFNFPVGAMFWIRSAVLQRLLALRLSWNDYPEEPLAPDGTLLHGLERLLPFVAESTGLRNALTTVNGVSR
jgi:hypothetical protein